MVGWLKIKVNAHNAKENMSITSKVEMLFAIFNAKVELNDNVNQLYVCK